jgi:hypothetical protein
MVQDVYNLERILESIKGFASSDRFRITLHGQYEMAEENIKLDEVQEAIATGEIIENYQSINEVLVVYSMALLKAEEAFT